MGSPDAAEQIKLRKPYDKPTATKLTQEEAKCKLIDYASRGDEGAKAVSRRGKETINNHEEKASMRTPASNLVESSETVQVLPSSVEWHESGSGGRPATI